jgi:hypothetical protein
VGYTTDDLITAVKMRGLIPTSQTTFDDTDFIRFMNEEMSVHIIPKIMTARENYFVESLDRSVVASQSNYEIPTRAVGSKVKDVYFINAQGDSKKLWLANLDDIADFSPTQGGEPEAFYFQGNDVVILPTPLTAEGTIRFYYFMRRNELVATTAAGKITQIVSTVLTLNTVPTTFTTSEVYDIVKGTPAFQNYSIDQVPSAVGASSITFTSVSSSLAVNDYVCLAGQSVIPQLPLEFFPVLIQRTLIRCLRALNDASGAEQAKKDLKEMEEDAIRLISIRAEDQKKRISSTSGISSFILNSYRR